MAKPFVKITIKNKAQLTKKVEKYGDNFKEVLTQVLDSTFNEMVEYAKANAVWIDRTGNARRSIDSVDLSSGNVVRFYLTIGVDYGIWLELANDGKYRILTPTMAIYEPRIYAVLKQLGVKIIKQGNITESNRA